MGYVQGEIRPTNAQDLIAAGVDHFYLRPVGMLEFPEHDFEIHQRITFGQQGDWLNTELVPLESKRVEARIWGGVRLTHALVANWLSSSRF